MPHVVKITVDDDGEKTGRKTWCYVTEVAAGDCTLCGGEYFGEGDSSAKYVEKHNGKITCPDCIDIIKKIKAIRL